LPRLPCERTDILVYDDPLRVYQKGLRRAVHAIVDGCAALAIDGDGLVGIAELSEPRARLGILVLPVQADDRHDPGLTHFQQHAVLRSALAAPRAPHVEQVP